MNIIQSLTNYFRDTVLPKKQEPFGVEGTACHDGYDAGYNDGTVRCKIVTDDGLTVTMTGYFGLNKGDRIRMFADRAKLEECPRLDAKTLGVANFETVKRAPTWQDHLLRP